MKANEIIGHLEKDKNNVSKIIKGRRELHSPNSLSTSKISSLSFCRSNNSFGQNNKSSLSNIDLNCLNYTYEDDVCNNLRRRTQSKSKHLKFNINNLPIKKELKSENKLHDYNEYENELREASKTQSENNDLAEEQKHQIIDQMNKESSIPKHEKSSGSINWEFKDEEKEHESRRNTGYIDKCIEDIKKYYELSKLEEQKKIADAEYEEYNNFVNKSDSSKSSSFCMGGQDKGFNGNIPEIEIEGIIDDPYSQLEDNRSPNPIGSKENELCKFQRIDWPNPNIALFSNEENDRSPKSSRQDDGLISQLNK